MTTLNLGHLATFRLVVQRGSFSAAADVMGISQPAVSLQIRQLEQFLQTRLIERTGRGIKATAAGEALRVHGERLELAQIHRGQWLVSEWLHAPTHRGAEARMERISALGPATCPLSRSSPPEGY